jgi:hypothetical protein
MLEVILLVGATPPTQLPGVAKFVSVPPLHVMDVCAWVGEDQANEMAVRARARWRR